MKMKKEKILLSLLTILTLTLIGNVEAKANGKGYVTRLDNSPAHGLRYTYGESNPYKDHYFNVNYNGSSYEAYCVDPGRHFNSLENGGHDVNCEPIEGKYAMEWLANHLTGNHIVDQLAIRMTAIRSGNIVKTYDLINSEMADITNYINDRDAGKDVTGKYLIAENEAGQTTLDQAYALYHEAWFSHNSESTYSAQNTVSLPEKYKNIVVKEFEKTNSNDLTSQNYWATFTVEASDTIDAKDISFTCQDCTVTSWNWDGKKGNVSISVNNKKWYKVSMVYNSSSSGSATNLNTIRSFLVCRTTNDNIQNLVLMAPISEIKPEKVVQNLNAYAFRSFSESLNPSSICDPNDPNCQDPGDYPCDPNDPSCQDPGNYPCDPNDPSCQDPNNDPDELTCNQKTSINKPTFCDSSNEQQMTIVSPTDVRACILKEKETDEAYELMSNKYCSVWCKEDYNIRLPGAQYATSGRYFQTKNVLVNGTKTCYTTSPESETDDYKTNIAINDFIDDIKKAQQEFVELYNKYARLEAINGLAVSDSDSCSGQHQVEGDIEYYTLKLGNCNNLTGVCDITFDSVVKREHINQTWGAVCGSTGGGWHPDGGTWEVGLAGHQEDEYSYEEPPYKITCRKTGSKYICQKYAPNETSSNVGENPNYENDFTKAKAEMLDKNREIQDLINQIGSCYNWDTNYCFNANIEFDYQEQYNSEINFQRIDTNDPINNATVAISNDSSNNFDYKDNEFKNVNESGFTNSIGYASFNCVTDANTGLETCNFAKSNTASIPQGEKVYHVKKTATINAEYKNKQEFKANYPHGSIETLPSGTSVVENYAYLGAIFPVALKTPTGVYNWQLKISNLGQYNDGGSCRYGRLDKVANKLNTSLDYVCVYVVDCPECTYSCECPPNLSGGYSCTMDNMECVIEGGPSCPECEYECEGSACNFCVGVTCLYNGNTQYMFRQISLNDINPNNRTLGFNWSDDKGRDTKAAIEEQGDNAYKNAEYSYKLTADNMKNIRERNKKLGNYVDGDGLEYKSIVVDNIEFSNIAGYSNFLNTANSDGKSIYFTQIVRNKTWTIYPKAVEFAKSIRNLKGYNGTIENAIGPAWK